MGNKNFIEINGKRYDAVTGKLLDSVSNPQKSTITTVAPRTNVGVMDGFVRKPKKPHAVASPAVKQPQKSNTLMRKTVQKPATPTVKPLHAKPTVQKSQLGTSHRRVQTAMQVPKSQQIKKYNESSTVSHATPQNSHTSAPQNSKVTTQHTNNAHTSNAQSIKPAHNAAAQRMITSALANADAHNNQPAPVHHRKRRNKILRKLGISNRAASISAGVLAIALLAGFFAIQNVPNLSMRVAAARAGFDAQMPAYQPSGFSFKGPINYRPGQVTVSFKSNTDNRTYEVKQQASNWNSDALLANYVVAENKQYQTYLDRGRTLYIYDGSNATWVDNGVWYQIEGESDMTTDQLIRIASSI